MTKLAILNNGLYTKICLLEDEEIVFFNTNFHKPTKGNIYSGIIKEVKEALMGVFVQYDNNKQGFLSFSSIHPKYLLHKNKEEIIHNMRQSFQNIDHICKDIGPMIKVGQKILVQIIREPNSYKQAMLSSYISIGDKITYIPNSIRYKTFFNSKLPIKYKQSINNFIKTNKIEGSFSIQKEIDIQHIQHEINTWNTIYSKFENTNVCELLYEANNIMKTIFLHNDNIDQCLYDNKIHNKIQENITNYWPEIQFQKDENISKKLYNQINDIFKNIHQLNCGGFLLWNTNHACTTIDINLGHNQKKDYEQSILSTNFEAAQLIAQQIKLKNIGGLIVIDFLKMNDDNQIEMINDYMSTLIKGDYVKIKLEKMNSFGVMMLCRQHLNHGFSVEEVFEKDKDVPLKNYKLLDQLLDELKIYHNRKLSIHMSNNLYMYIINNHTKISNNLNEKYNIKTNKEYGFSIIEEII